MELKEVQEYIKANAEKPEVQNYIKGFVTPDGVKAFIDSDEGMKLLQPKLDQYFTKGLETWKTNNLTKIVDEQVNKVVLEKYPKETEEQKRLHKLETDLANETSKRQKAEMYNQAIQEAAKRNISPELIEHFLGNDIDSTRANLSKFEEYLNARDKKTVDGIFKQYGRLPDKGQVDNAGLFTQAEVRKMSPEEERINHKKVLESMKHW